jgi:hypothetical protein
VAKGPWGEDFGVLKVRPKHCWPVSFGSTGRIRRAVGSIARLIEEAAMRFASYVRRVEAMYRVTDRLHGGRTLRVPGHEIAPIVSAWLAELDVQPAGRGSRTRGVLR